MTDELGPFLPSAGRSPPYLAGREGEHALLRAFAASLRRREPSPSGIVLQGPRGNGKTVLLGWLRAEVAAGNARREEKDAEIETIWLTPAQIPTAGRLIERVARESWLMSRWKRRSATGGVPGMVNASLKTPESGAPALEDALSDRVGRKPFILLLDEAHNLDPEIGHALLNASQQVGREAPFLLVLAGTPDLEDRLQGMGVSFWDRAEQLRIGRLPEEASGEAIRKPLAGEGISIRDGLLADAYRDHHGYPFFVQHWGRELWRRARDRSRVTGAHLAEAREAVETVRQRYYWRRHREMQRSGLLMVARAAAEAFRAPPESGREHGYRAFPHLANHDLHAAIRRGLGAECSAERMLAAESKLRHLGYIWPTDHRADWEPGIPSLMAYMWSVIPAEPLH